MATPEQINLLLSKAEWKWATLVNESLIDFQNGCPMCFNPHLERMWELISALTYQLEILDYTSETTQNIYDCLFLLVQEDDPNPNTDPNFQYDDQVLIVITDNLNPNDFVKRAGPAQTVTSPLTFQFSPLIPNGNADNEAVAMGQFENGIVTSAESVGLGGSLVRDTFIDMAGKYLIIGDGAFTSLALVPGSAVMRGTSSGQPVSKVDLSANQAILQYTSVSGPYKSISFGATNMTVTDTLSLTGLKNAGDYEASFTGRSLITKQFGDANYAPISGGGYVSSVSGTTNRITSTGGVTPQIDISATFEALLGKVASPLSQFASTTSAQLAGIISDKTGTGALVFGDSPVLLTPNLDTPSVLVGTNITGTASGLNIGGNAATVTNGVYTTTYNTLGDARYLRLDGSNANQSIDIGAYRLTAGDILGTYGVSAYGPISSQFSGPSTVAGGFINTSNSGSGVLIQGGNTFSTSRFAVSILDYGGNSIAAVFSDKTTFNTTFTATINAGAANNFVVSNSGLLQYRTAAQVLSDIGAAPSSGGSYVASVTGTANRITSTGGTTPVIDISSSYSGQSSITTVGTLSAGSIPWSLLTSVPTLYIGTTAHALNRASASEALTGITSIDGSAAKWTTGRTLSITGDISYTSPSFDGSGNVTAAATMATVNANTGIWGSATQSPIITLDGKGRAVAASSVVIQIGEGQVTGLIADLAAKQTALSGTGFVKISGTTISYDNSTYLTTSSASSTYLPLTGGTLSGTLNVVYNGGTNGSFIKIEDTNVTNAGIAYFGNYQGNALIQAATTGKGILFYDNASERMRLVNGGLLAIGYTADPTSGNKLAVNGNGYFNGSVTATSFIKSGGTSSQYLMADGSVTASTSVANFANTNLTFTGSRVHDVGNYGSRSLTLSGNSGAYKTMWDCYSWYALEYVVRDGTDGVTGSPIAYLGGSSGGIGNGIGQIYINNTATSHGMSFDPDRITFNKSATIGGYIKWDNITGNFTKTIQFPDLAGTVALTNQLPIHGNSTTTGTATTAVTVTIGSTMANTNYYADIAPQDLLTAVNWYISAKTTTTFTVTFVTALTGSINFDWVVLL